MMINVSDSASAILDRLESAGESAYVVGGCVRDALRGVEPHDWDICTSASPEKVQSIFERTYPTGLKHGTVTVLSHGEPIEVTTFRSDGEYSDGRRPDSVNFIADVEPDLLRRDFTVNAIAWSPARGLCDPSGGIHDLELNILRAVGDPQRRFREDALRILRALRFASVCGFEIEKDTAAALHSERGLLRPIAAERVTSELLGMLRGDGAGEVSRLYRDVIAVRLPSVAGTPLEIFDALAHERSHGALTRLAILLCRAGSESGSAGDLPRLRLARKDMHTVETLIRTLNEMPSPPEDIHGMFRLARGVGADAAGLYLDAAEAFGHDVSPMRDMLRQIAGRCLSPAELAVNGRDLMSLGIFRRNVGTALETLLESAACGELPNDREMLLSAAKELVFGGKR